jgi:hypothetical protein
MSYGRVFSQEENLAYIRHLAEYHNSISGLPALPATGSSKSTHIPTRDDFPNVIGPPFYKYVKEDVWERNKSGSFRLHTALHYRSTADINIQDIREGMGAFHLIHGNNQLNVGILSGFNAALYCGTKEIGDRAFMSKRFGNVLIKIHPIKEFVTRIAKHIRAADFHVYDIVYRDQKNFISHYEHVKDFYNIVRQQPGADLTTGSLHSLNKRFFDLFYDVSRMPSLFSKPIDDYQREQERRIVFEFGADLKSDHVPIQDCSLLDFIEVI